MNTSKKSWRFWTKHWPKQRETNSWNVFWWTSSPTWGNPSRPNWDHRIISQAVVSHPMRTMPSGAKCSQGKDFSKNYSTWRRKRGSTSWSICSRNYKRRSTSTSVTIANSFSKKITHKGHPKQENWTAAKLNRRKRTWRVLKNLFASPPSNLRINSTLYKEDWPILYINKN